MLTVIASNALYFLAAHAKYSFISTHANWSGVFYEAITSLISAIPYIVLFIALSLLATDGEPDKELFGIEPELT